MTLDAPLTEQFKSSDFSRGLDSVPKTYDPVGTEARWQSVWQKTCLLYTSDAADE